MIREICGLNKASAQKIQRGLRGAPANQLAIAGNVEFAVLGLDVAGERDIDSTNRLLFSTTARTGDARDRQPEVSASSFANALGHRFRYRRTDRPVLEQQYRLNT